MGMFKSSMLASCSHFVGGDYLSPSNLQLVKVSSHYIQFDTICVKIYLIFFWLIWGRNIQRDGWDRVSSIYLGNTLWLFTTRRPWQLDIN